MTIIGLFYLLLIMGWILLILILKCKRARAKRLAEEQVAVQAAQCHVIQIGSNYYDIVPSNHPFSASHYRSCSALHMDDATSHHHSLNSEQTHTNPAFIIDEVGGGGGGGGGGGVFPTTGALPDLPPSYDDVMRLPSSYPKLAPVPPQRLNTAPPEIVSRYPDGPAIIEVTNIENRIDSNNNNNNNPQQTTLCTCSHSSNHERNNNNSNSNSGITVRRQSDVT